MGDETTVQPILQPQPQEQPTPEAVLPVAEAGVSPTSPKPIRWKLIGSIVGGAVLFTGVIGGGYAYYRQQQITQSNSHLSSVEQQATQVVSPTTKVTKSPTTTPETVIETIKYSLEGKKFTWLQTPQEVTSPNIFVPYDKTEESQPYLLTDEAEWKKVADISTGEELYVVLMPVDAPSLGLFLRVIKNTDQSFYLISDDLNEYAQKNIANQLLSTVKFATAEIPDLNPPEELTVNNLTFKKGLSLDLYFSYLKDPKLFGESNYGNMYISYQTILESDQIFARSFYLKLPDQTVVAYYLPDDILTDDQVAKVTWIDGEKNLTGFSQNLVATCGNTMAYSRPVIKKVSGLVSDKYKVGVVDATQQEVYQLSGAQNDLVKGLYSYFVGPEEGYYGKPPETSLEDYAKQRSYFLWQDQLGDWQIFASNEYMPLAECGKPVIYLYPEKETQVSVQVGADITKSEPQYPENGWQVIAQPDGNLSYQNKVYPYLFWEGLGKGAYPDYRDRGVVVSRDLLVETLTDQLQRLGLNEKESADFLEFWQPRLPATQFTRLTWFGTAEMNELAPLTISPQPDTMIRIFLEFEGLDYQKKLIPQRLSSVKRQGFTVVEWGGLLVGE